MAAHAASPAPERIEEPPGDHIVVLHGATWADYQRMLELRGDRAAPRIAYLEGRLQIMRPSKPHESVKTRIGRLVEIFCLEHSIWFDGVGSWTIDPKRPDLAIEVVWTSGGIDNAYEERTTSEALPQIDLVHLAGFLDLPLADARLLRREGEVWAGEVWDLLRGREGRAF